MVRMGESKEQFQKQQDERGELLEIVHEQTAKLKEKELEKLAKIKGKISWNGKAYDVKDFLEEN